MTKVDIDYLEFAIDSIIKGLNKLELEMGKLRKDEDDTSISLKEIHDWADNMHEEMEKHKKSDRYFQNSLKDTHKQTCERFEGIVSDIKKLFANKYSYMYSSIKGEDSEEKPTPES